MNLELPLPVIRNPEPIAVPQLESLFSKAGIDLAGKRLFWTGAGSLTQCYHLIDAESISSEIRIISFLSEDEKIIFRAFQDWYSAAIRKVSDASRGYYTFDVLQFEVGDAPWSWSDFTALLTAHAKKLIVNERIMIQFGTLWGVLHKRTEAEFGRVESKLQLDFCKPAPEALARFIKKQMTRLPAPPPLLVLRDVSRTAICSGTENFESLQSALEKTTDSAVKPIYWHPATKLCQRV